MFGLPPLRHTPTLPSSPIRRVVSHRLQSAEGGRRDAPLFESIEKGLCRLEIGRVEPLNRSKTKTTISAAAGVSFSCYPLSA
jgi:hypothetical protein